MPRVRIIAFVSVVLTLLLAALPSRGRYFCPMMDRVLDSPCCPSVSTLEIASSEPRASSPDCCKRLSAGRFTSVAARDESLKPPSIPALPPTAALDFVSPARREVLYPRASEQAPPPVRGPPLFLKNCVFLI